MGGFKVRLPRRKTIPARDFIVFNTALATLLKAGLPLVQSLDILRKRVPNPTFKMALDDIYEKVRASTPRRSWPARRAGAWNRFCAATCTT